MPSYKIEGSISLDTGIGGDTTSLTSGITGRVKISVITGRVTSDAVYGNTIHFLGKTGDK